MQSTLSYRDAVTLGAKRSLSGTPIQLQPPVMTDFKFDFLPSIPLAASNTPSIARAPASVVIDNAQWAANYNDPRAKIILVSREGVHYRFHCSQMSKHSGLIEHLHSLTKHTNNDNPPIETDCPNLSLRIFAHYITHMHSFHNSHKILMEITSHDTIPVDHLPNLDTLPTSHLINLLALSDRFQMSHQFEDAVLIRLTTRAITDPWTVFIVACNRRDIVLARRAIVHFGTGHNIPANRLHDIKPFEVAGLPMEYLLELMRLRLSGGEVDYPTSGTGDVRKGHVLTTWAHVARVFMRDKHVEEKTGRDGKIVAVVASGARRGGKGKIEKSGRAGRASASKTK